MSVCADCDGPVDTDGDTTGDCPVNRSETCDTCGACYCDGSC